MDTFLQQIVNGLTLGSVYAVVALGYTMVYGIIQLINFAHGEVVMIGALTAYSVIVALTGAQVPLPALAIVLSEMILPNRWYWAAFAAFVMFQGTRSRGESIAKGMAFILGTTGGLVGGVLLATLLAGHDLASLGVIVVAVFLAFQANVAAYGVMVFWITIILGLLFGMLGYFTFDVLLLRLEEAAVGVISTRMVPFGNWPWPPPSDHTEYTLPPSSSVRRLKMSPNDEPSLSHRHRSGSSRSASVYDHWVEYPPAKSSAPDSPDARSVIVTETVNP